MKGWADTSTPGDRNDIFMVKKGRCRTTAPFMEDQILRSGLAQWLI